MRPLWEARKPQPETGGIRAGGHLCWCCGRPGVPDSRRPGWFTCGQHTEGQVSWYGGLRRPPL